MARIPATFRQRDVTAAIKAVVAAGCEVARVEVDTATGKIIITTIDPAGAVQTSDLDKWMANHARASEGH